MRQILFACILLGALSACTEGGFLNKEKKYTPLYLYYNPFQPALDLAGSIRTPEKDYPNYLNYPTDCVKHGLRGCVALVSYIGRDIVYSEFDFDKEGKLTRAGRYIDAARRYAEVRDFKYDSMGKLEGVYRNGYNSNLQEFEYDTSGKLIKRKGGLTYAYQTYTYYDNGTLKDITPDRLSDDYSNLNYYGKMEFNESGELAKAGFVTTFNPFLGDNKSRFYSVCIFSYADNGLCTNKNETMYYKKAHPEVDSICCRNVYTYNEKGDLLRWDYSDTEYRNQTSQSGNNLAFLFEYKYDRHDNWITMKIILPDCYIDNPRALDSFAREHNILGQLFMGIKEQNKPATITIERQISYHAFPTSESKKSSSKKPHTT